MNCDELQEFTAAFALGSLDSADADKLHAAMEANPKARLELASFHDTVAALAIALASPATPPPELRAKVLARIARQPNPTPSDAGGIRFVLNDAHGWQPGPLPGLRIKALAVSQDMGYRVLLAELAPGTVFPAHEHQSSEELFVVSGHLETEGRVLGPGDFLHAEPGTHHQELRSPDGCVALLIDRAPVPVS